MREDRGQRTEGRGILMDMDRLFDHFMNRFEERGLVVMPRPEAEELRQQADTAKLRKTLLRKKALSFREISDGMIWTHSDGRKLSPTAVRIYALNNARPEELLKVGAESRGTYLLVTSAVQRLAIQRGHATTL